MNMLKMYGVIIFLVGIAVVVMDLIRCPPSVCYVDWARAVVFGLVMVAGIGVWLLGRMKE